MDAAIRRVLGQSFEHAYWFGNDHALLILDRSDGAQASVIIRRIVDQVAVSPVQMPGRYGATDFISVCSAIKSLSYRSLRDLACGDAATLRKQLTLVVDLLRVRAGRCEGGDTFRPSSATANRPVLLVK